MRKSVLLASLAVVLNSVSGMNPNEEIRILRQQNCQMQNIIRHLRRANSFRRDEINRLRKANDSQTEEIDNLQQVASTKMDEIDYLLKVNKSQVKEIDNLRNENVSQMDTINYLKNANDFQTNEINDLLSISNYYCTNGYLLKEVAWWRSQSQLLQEKLGYEEDSYHEEASPIEIDENGSLTYNCESGEIFPARGGVFSRRFSMPGGLWSLENTEHQSAFNARSVEFNRDKEDGKNLSIDKKDEKPVSVTIAEQIVSPVVREAIKSSKQLSNSENQKLLLDLFSEIEKSSSEGDVAQPEIESLNQENSEKKLSEEKNNENQAEIEVKEKLMIEEDSKNPLFIQKDIGNTLGNSTKNTNKTLIEERNVEEKKTIPSEQKSEKKKKQEEKALFSAIQTVDIAKVQNLVNANESLINAQTNSENTPLIMVLQNHTNDREKIEKCKAIAYFILSKGPDFSIKNVKGATALSEAMDYVYSYLVKPTIELLHPRRGISEDKRQNAGVAVKKFCLIYRLLNNLPLESTDYEIIKNSGNEFEFSKRHKKSSLDAARFLLESDQFNVEMKRFLPDVLDFYNRFYNAATDETQIESAIRAALDLDIDKILEKMDSELKLKISEKNLAENQEVEDKQKDSSKQESKKKKKKKKKKQEKDQNNPNPVESKSVLESILKEEGYLKYQWPLIQAIRKGELDKVVHLVKQGANINYSYGNGITPLNVAVSHGQSEIVNFLITQGVDFDEWTNISDSLLEKTIISCSEENKESWKGKSPDELINILKVPRQVELLQKLVIETLRTGNLDELINMKNQGLNLNSRIRVHGLMFSLLDYAIQFGQAKIIEYLVDERVDSDIFMLDEEKIEETIRKISEQNKDVWQEVSLDTIINKIKAEKNRRVLLTSLVEAMKIGDLDKVEKLRDEGVDLNYTFWSGETLLDYAIQFGQAKIIEYLVDKRVDSDIFMLDEEKIEETIRKISEQNKEVWQGNPDQIINLIKSEKQRRKIEKGTSGVEEVVQQQIPETTNPNNGIR